MWIHVFDPERITFAASRTQIVDECDALFRAQTQRRAESIDLNSELLVIEAG